MVQVCIFDGNSNLLFQTYWTTVDEDPDSSYGDWQTDDQITFTRTITDLPYTGKERVTIEPGPDEKTGIRFSAFGIGLALGIAPYDSYSAPLIGDGLPLPPSTFRFTSRRK